MVSLFILLLVAIYTVLTIVIVLSTLINRN